MRISVRILFPTFCYYFVMKNCLVSKQDILNYVLLAHMPSQRNIQLERAALFQGLSGAHAEESS